MTPSWGEVIVSTKPIWKRVFVCIFLSFGLFMCSPQPTQYIFHTPIARYSLYVLKVPLNTKQTNKPWDRANGWATVDTLHPTCVIKPHFVVVIIIISSLLLYHRFLTSFSVSPYLSVLSCPFECNKAAKFVKSCSIWILLHPLVGLPFILPSVISCKSPLYLKTWPIHRWPRAGSRVVRIDLLRFLSGYHTRRLNQV